MIGPRFLGVALLTVVLTSFATEVAAQDCLGRTVVYYVNGIDNDRTAAETSKVVLEQELRRHLGSGCRAPSVFLAWNPTAGFAADLLESIEQLTRHVENDDPALLTHLRQYRAFLEDGYQVVVVAHSQGNLYANAAFDVLAPELGIDVHDRFAIVAVATPDGRVGFDPNPDTAPYVTHLGDIIRHVPSALTPYQPAPCTEGLVGEKLCHNFVQSYLTFDSSRERVLELIDRSLRRPAITDLLPSYVETGLTSQVFSLVGDGFRCPSFGGRCVTVRLVGPDGARRDIAPYFVGIASVGIVGFTAIVADPGEYLLSVVNPDGSESVPVTLSAHDPSPNRSPLPMFSMSVPGTLVVAPTELGIVADPLSLEARVTFEDLSTDPDGRADIVSRRWTTDTGCTPVDPPPCPLSDGLVSFTWGFQPGRYTVTLRIQDSAGHTATESAIVEVAAPPVPELPALPNTGTAPEGSIDPYWSLRSGPTCPTGDCQVFSASNTDNNTTSKWIRPVGDTESADPAGDYVFRLAFHLTDVEAQTAIVTGRWATDDFGTDILINGVSTGQQATTSFVFTSFVVAGGFVPGVNTLDFVVHNQDCPSCPLNPVALRVELVGRAIDGTSLPLLTQLPNTGSLGVGQSDPHYPVVSGGTCPSGVCLPFTSTGDATSAAIVPTNATTHPSGQYIYRLGFMVSELEVPLARIAGRWYADDRGIDILINGVPTGFSSPQFGTFAPFLIAGHFRPGINTLDFIVTNQDCGDCDGNPTALRVELTGSVLDTPPPTLTSIYPEESMVAFGQPVIDAAGALYVARSQYGFGCGYGLCWTALQKIVPNGDGWLGPPLGNFLNPALISIGPSDRVYFEGRQNELHAYESDGSTPVGFWPVEITAFYNNRFFGPPLIDYPTGEVFAEAHTFGACYQSCFRFIRALRSDGSDLWSKQLYLQFSGAPTLFLGPNRDTYISDDTQMIRFERETGNEVCRTPIHSVVGWIGTPDGLFAGNGNAIQRIAADCSNSRFFEADVTRYSVEAYAAGRLFGFETAASQDRLFGLTADGHSIWRQEGIAPAANSIRAFVNNVLYVLGVDRTDGLPKLFLVQADNGTITRRVDLLGVCSSCGVAVSPSGTVYVNDLNSTKLFRVVW